MNPVSNYVWVYEDPCADDPTHDGHRGAKQTKLPSEFAALHCFFGEVFGRSH
jgi:hypothetical protein